MRFARSDLPGLAIALLAGPALMVLHLAAFEIWDHHGTPLLGFLGANIGIAVGLAAVFSRFILKWDVPLVAVGAIIAIVAAVNWAQHTDNDGTRLATGLKWAGVVAFLVLNVSIIQQLLNNGLLPLLNRRDVRKAAEQASEQ
jgi:hypothetical protein